jgi:DNA-binding NarL/FixJ family response regulator
LNQDIGNQIDESTKPIRVLLADSYALFREALKKEFGSEPRFAVVGEARDGNEALELIARLEPDVLLMDCQISPLSGMDILQSISGRNVATRTILLTADIERDQISQAFQLGAQGLVFKEASIHVLFSSIESIISGRYWMGSESFSDLDEILKKLREGSRKSVKPKNFNLTPQEIRIIASVASGHTNKRIAKEFSITEQTVKHHITNIFDKLGVYNRLELTLFALHHKLIEDAESQS